MLTDAQVRLYRRKRTMDLMTQEAAAAAAGISVRSGRTWEHGALPSEAREARHWRTREDPLDGVWEEVVVPLLKRDTDRRLHGTTLLEVLREHDSTRFTDERTLRTLQRRMRDWRALHGPAREVYFQQEHPPGREGALDFTHGDALGVTIAGVALAHLWFTFRLSFSGWTFINLAFGETYEALLSGFQQAVWTLGGVPKVVRHDNLSAATRKLKKSSSGRSLTQRWKSVMEHYGCRSSRIKPRHAHENGIAEKGNALVKTALEQALLVRGSRNFRTRKAYVDWARKQVDQRLNAKRAEKLQAERSELAPLPAARLPTYTEYSCTVRKWSTVRVGGRAYSVPSRLIGHKLVARQYPDHVEVFYGDDRIARMPRLRGAERTRIDYRHVIWSLARKPGAFQRYKFREELFPRPVFRQAYDALVQWRGQRADIEYVRILHLAAATMEERVATSLEVLLEVGERFDYLAVRALAEPPKPTLPGVTARTPDLEQYDRLLGGSR